MKLIDYTIERTVNANILHPSEQKEVIKEEGGKEEEDSNKNGPDETGTKLTAVNK